MLRAGIHENLRWRVIEGVSVHRFDDGDIVSHSGQVRQQFGEFSAAFAVPGKFVLRTEQLRVRVNEGGTVTFEQFSGRKFSVPFGQFGFVIEQFQMAGRAGHKEKDDALGFGREVRLFRGERIRAGDFSGGGKRVFVQQ